MAKDFYMREMRAGRYRKVVRYSRTLPSDSKTVRAAKQAATNSAQKFINIKNATERLQLLLCANFDSKAACFCTFTFTDEALPANRKHAKAMFSFYLRKLRSEWSRKERELKYLYTIEGDPQAKTPVDAQQWEIAPWRDKERWAQLDTVADQRDKERWAQLDTVADQEESNEPTRFHAHCFLLLSKEDYETVRALWPYGQVYISQMKVNELTTFHRLASYVTKESRSGSKGNGARAYVPSLNLEQPVIEGHWCSEHEGITLPSGAEAIKSGAERNDIYGSSMEYLFYRLPRATQQPQPYKSKGKLSHKKSRHRRQ